MVFNSFNFIIFFPVVFLIYYLIPIKARYLWLLLASYYFYMNWNAKYVLLLLFSTIITFIFGRLISYFEYNTWLDIKQKVIRKKSCVAICCGLNLTVLFLFKYFDMFIGVVNRLLLPFQLSFPNPEFDFLLPVGISFYTFQALGYTIDVYRKEVNAEKNFLKYALFVSFFPQLVAGPIERSKNLLKQIAEPHRFDLLAVKDGGYLMLWGYFLKVVLADRIAIFVNSAYSDTGTRGGVFLITATILFAFQIYCDFAGYSIIAAGAARMLGYHLMENFSAPYFSQSTAEFWRRWHISLSSWLKDYLYIPLGGSRKGTIRKYQNLLLIFFISGLWHGASFHYIAWGIINGSYLVLGKFLQPFRNACIKLFHLHTDTFAHKMAKTIFTFMLIDFSWIFFRAESLSGAVQIVKSMLRIRNPWILFDGSLYSLGLSAKNFWLMILCIFLLLAADFCKYKKICIRKVIQKQDFWFRYLVVVGSIAAILLFGIWGNEYNASTFIYFQF